jgi:transcriptional regulator with XRE-family HTH domain
MLIQKLRLQRGWSQEQLADLSGLSVCTVQRFERGQPASVESLKALGAAFEVDFSALRSQT